jgi:predicted anti-sigma-YlaC factor YlaD
MPNSFCRLARRHFSDHLDGARLPLLPRLVVAMHLRVCPQCKRFNRSLEATRDALGALRDVDVDTDGGDKPR